MAHQNLPHPEGYYKKLSINLLNKKKEVKRKNQKKSYYPDQYSQTEFIIIKKTEIAIIIIYVMGS
ncbi:hypothetical protein SEEGA711_22355 [Salmonella enterica subsp. enterica serovar Gaminara str. ATCC BAA-711]|nr:hypothetical protein SEEGA711_22355 [Salmonella enterica subsp. enterica serovar Gaminara str. ATCC BAA-711]